MFKEIREGNPAGINNISEVVTVEQRYVLAGASGLSRCQMEEFCRDDAEAVRRRLAENIETPADILMDLACDESAEVRASVSENGNTPVPILEFLAQDQSVDVRFSIAENHRIPLHILQIVARDENPFVAARARHTIQVLDLEATASAGANLCQKAAALKALATTWRKLPQVRAV